MSFFSVNNICKSYPTSNGDQLSVLDNVSFSANKGEFVSILGPNGCGKTTLLMIVAGIETSDSGSFLFQNGGAIGNRFGIVFQNYRDALLPWRSNLDNLCFPLELGGKSKVERRTIVDKLAQELDLKIELNSYPYQLSGGQQQLLSLGRALISDPDLLLLDEPLSSLDFQTALRMCDEIQDIWLKTRITTLLISHDIDDTIFLSDRIILLTKLPARIGDVFEVDLERPRTNETRKSRRFFELRNAILDSFREVAAT